MERLKHEPASCSKEEPPSADRVRAALLQIAPRYQAVIALHYFERIDLEQIANTLGVKLGTVKSRLSRGREALRRKLEKLGVRR